HQFQSAPAPGAVHSAGRAGCIHEPARYRPVHLRPHRTERREERGPAPGSRLVMSGERPNAIFNIGSQHGNVSNVAGDMTVYGGQHYTALPAEMIKRELRSIQG